MINYNSLSLNSEGFSLGTPRARYNQKSSNTRPHIKEGESVFYRGWMQDLLTPSLNLQNAILHLLKILAYSKAQVNVNS
jgi:hypothetical protein